MKKNIGIILICLLFTNLVCGQSNVELFDKYVEAARQEWNVPGLSIVVVQDGKVVLSKGYGVRELGKDARVDTETLFGAMSTTKAMTTAAMGMLVDEGKVSWDDKVTKYLPNFRVADHYVTGELRVRDLFTHNSGIGSTDFLWMRTPELSSDQIVSRMQYVKQIYPFRSGFNSYQNVMYLVAGQVIEKASGMPWKQFVTERIFKPLGMKNTFATYEDSKKYKNRSVAHFDFKGKIQPIPETSIDSAAPAGAVWSTADDIGKWVNFMLGNTTADGKQLLKPETFKEILSPQVISPPGEFYDTQALTKPHWITYGLGWDQHDYRGLMVNLHVGSLDGRMAMIGLMPDKKLGVYVFGNLRPAEVNHALMYKTFDVFGFNDNSRDWSKEVKSLYDGLKADARKKADEIKVKRKTDTVPSLPLSAYAGKYSDPFYGEMEVALVGGKLRMIVNKDLTADLSHWQFNAFQAAWNKAWWDESLLDFQINPLTGEVDSMTIDGENLKRVRPK